MRHYASIDEVIASFPERFKPEAAAGVDAVLQFTLTGTDDQRFYLIVRDGTLGIEHGVHPDPTMSVTTSAENWLALNNGETSPMALLMQGKATFNGSASMALKFREIFEAAG